MNNAAGRYLLTALLPSNGKENQGRISIKDNNTFGNFKMLKISLLFSSNDSIFRKEGNMKY
jgi:hypothetical protein